MLTLSPWKLSRIGARIMLRPGAPRAATIPTEPDGWHDVGDSLSWIDPRKQPCRISNSAAQSASYVFFQDHGEPHPPCRRWYGKTDQQITVWPKAHRCPRPVAVLLVDDERLTFQPRSATGRPIKDWVTAKECALLHLRNQGRGLHLCRSKDGRDGTAGYCQLKRVRPIPPLQRRKEPSRPSLQLFRIQWRYGMRQLVPMNGAGHLVFQVFWGGKFLAKKPTLPASDFIDQSNLAIFRLRTCLQEDKDRLPVSRFQSLFVSSRDAARLRHTVARPQDQDHKIGFSHSAKASNLRRARPSAKVLRHDGSVPQPLDGTLHCGSLGFHPGNQRTNENLHLDTPDTTVERQR